MPCVSDALRAAWQCQWQSTMSVTFHTPTFPWLYVHAGLDPLRVQPKPQNELVLQDGRAYHSSISDSAHKHF